MTVLEYLNTRPTIGLLTSWEEVTRNLSETTGNTWELRVTPDFLEFFSQNTDESITFTNPMADYERQELTESFRHFAAGLSELSGQLLTPDRVGALKYLAHRMEIEGGRFAPTQVSLNMETGDVSIIPWDPIFWLSFEEDGPVEKTPPLTLA